MDSPKANALSVHLQVLAPGGRSADSLGYPTHTQDVLVRQAGECCHATLQTDFDPLAHSRNPGQL